MGFIGSSSARELDAQAELEQLPTDEIDYEVDIDYELDLDLAAEESESEFDFEDDAPAPPDAIPANNTSDLIDFFFREQARLAFLLQLHLQPSRWLHRRRVRLRPLPRRTRKSGTPWLRLRRSRTRGR